MHAPVLKKLLEEAFEEVSADFDKMQRESQMKHDIQRFRALIFQMSPQIFDHVMCRIDNELCDEMNSTPDVVLPIMSYVLGVAVNLATNIVLGGLENGESYIRSFHAAEETPEPEAPAEPEPTAPPMAEAPAPPDSTATVPVEPMDQTFDDDILPL